jgi:CRP/FNR family cyclic AMP-dependent transcriptional regulator
MPASRELVDRLSRLALFADLPRPQLEEVAHSFDEEVYAEGSRVLRQGLSGSNLFVILDGEAIVSRDGDEVTRLGPGEVFGEVSVLTGEPPTADVVARSMLRCLVVPGPEVERFLVERPRVMFRVLQSVAARIRGAYEWRE